MYQDQPAQVAEELLAAPLWPSHPLGRPLAGTLETRGGAAARRAAWTSGARATMRVRPCWPWRAAWTHEQVLAQVAPALAEMPAGRLPRCTPLAAGGPTADRRAARRRGPPRHRADAARPRFPRAGPARPAAVRGAAAEHAAGREDGFAPVPEPARTARAVLFGPERDGDPRRNGAAEHFRRPRRQAPARRAGPDPPRTRPALRAARRPRGNCGRRAITSSASTGSGLESTTNQMMWLGESLLGYGRIDRAARWRKRRSRAVTRRRRAGGGAGDVARTGSARWWRSGRWRRRRRNCCGGSGKGRVIGLSSWSSVILTRRTRRTTEIEEAGRRRKGFFCPLLDFRFLWSLCSSCPPC